MLDECTLLWKGLPFTNVSGGNLTIPWQRFQIVPPSSYRPDSRFLPSGTLFSHWAWNTNLHPNLKPKLITKVHDARFFSLSERPTYQQSFSMRYLLPPKIFYQWIRSTSPTDSRTSGKRPCSQAPDGTKNVLWAACSSSPAGCFSMCIRYYDLESRVSTSQFTVGSSSPPQGLINWYVQFTWNAGWLCNSPAVWGVGVAVPSCLCLTVFTFMTWDRMRELRKTSTHLMITSLSNSFHISF